jgi:hypothetical protein
MERFEEFLTERLYLKSVTDKTLVYYRCAFRSWDKHSQRLEDLDYPGRRELDPMEEQLGKESAAAHADPSVTNRADRASIALERN